MGFPLFFRVPYSICIFPMMLFVCALRLLDTRRRGGKGYIVRVEEGRVKRAAIRSASVFWDCRIKYAN